MLKLFWALDKNFELFFFQCTSLMDKFKYCSSIHTGSKVLKHTQISTYIHLNLLICGTKGSCLLT